MSTAVFDQMTEYERLHRPMHEAFHYACTKSWVRTDAKGHDVVYDHAYGLMRVEEKCDSHAPVNVFLELVQNIDIMSEGWVKYCDADIVNYLFPEHRTMVVLYWPLFSDRWVDILCHPDVRTTLSNVPDHPPAHGLLVPIRWLKALGLATSMEVPS